MIEDALNDKTEFLNGGEWQEKLNTKLNKVWVHGNGSKIDKTNPVVKCIFKFEGTTDPKTVFEAVNIIF